MGVSFYAYVVVGMRISEADLVVPVEPLWSCRSGHQHPKTVKFCPEDGFKVEARQSKAAKPEFAQFLRMRGLDPNDVDGALSYLVDLKGSPIHNVNRLQSGGDHMRSLAVGFRIFEVLSSDYGFRNENPTAMSIDTLNLHAAKVKTLARELGLDPDSRSIEVFTSMYVS